MLLGHARGKVGDLVFSRSNGEQVTRARAAVVKNPRTDIQLIQRIILNTVSQAYSKLQPLCDHSFEGVQVGQASMSRFMRRNIDNLRARVASDIAAFIDLDSIVAFTRLGSNLFAPNSYVVSSGSLPSVAVEVSTTTAFTAPVFDGASTYGEFINAAGLRRGDQLTFVCIKGSSLVEPVLSYARIILDPTSETGQPLSLDTPFANDGSVNMPSPRNTGVVSLLQNSGLVYNVGGDLPTLASCIIVSRQNNAGKWQRSNATLVLNEMAAVGEFDSLQVCLDAAKSGGISDESEFYLNNAGETPPINTQGASITRAYYGNGTGGFNLTDSAWPWPAAGRTDLVTDSELGGQVLIMGIGLTAENVAVVKVAGGSLQVNVNADGTRAYTSETLDVDLEVYSIQLGGEKWGGFVNTEGLRP